MVLLGSGRPRAAKGWGAAIADASCLVLTCPGFTCRILNCVQGSLKMLDLGAVLNREM